VKPLAFLIEFSIFTGDAGTTENLRSFRCGILESRFRRAGTRRARGEVFHFFFSFASMSVTRTICVIAASRQRNVAPSKPRNWTVKTGKRNRTEKGRTTTSKNGVCIAGIANGNIAGNLASCLKEINACLRTCVIRPRNSLHDKSLTRKLSP